MFNRKDMAKAAGFGAAATVTIGLLSAGAANADTFVPLPGGEIVKTLSDGTVVTVRLTGESANINPSLGATPVHRNAWVSGSASVDISSGSTAKGGGIYPGYTVGCQVNIGGGNMNGSANASGTYDGKSLDAGVGTGGTLNLGPGQAKSFYVIDREVPDDYGKESHSKKAKFTGEHGSVTWADETIALTGCGGYAQARAFVSTEIETDNVVTWVTLWGQPFSLG
ncbi:MspA family porin [Nocardia arthritidis]|uniref:Porin n=1 Tax=Nocardia arthritidis TaxID=228602 RepID=A0A6G9YR91_9NOCA|nr:MspA family porin [Nocardia arthritidis]QIS15825.1 porin [Nocardia arthritidis]